MVVNVRKRERNNSGAFRDFVLRLTETCCEYVQFVVKTFLGSIVTATGDVARCTQSGCRS
jgi:hypothetical protein